MSVTQDLPSRRPAHGANAFLRRPWLVAGVLAAVCVAMGLALSLVNWPVPRVHDEFSYLLAADTFAHGRLANPAHPHWEHLETFHVIQQPTYASKYPPGQGLALALGQVLFGEPLAGVWLLSGLAAAATYWMLLGWTSPRFAAWGGALWAAHPGFQLAWGQSYWGGTLAYIGGALVFGAALRMQRRVRTLDAVVMGAGAVVLAVSRPFEGFVFCAATGAWLLWRWLHAGPAPFTHLAAKVVLPLAVILGLGACALGAYHRAVTGDALTFPYAVHESTYGQCPMFIGQSPAPKPPYRHAEIDDFHSHWELDWHRRQDSLRGWINSKIAANWLSAEFLLTPVLTLGLLATRPWRWRRLTPVSVVAAATFAASLAVTWSLPHYLAPLMPLVILLAVAGLRRIDALGRRRWGGVRLAPLVVAAQAALFLIAAVQFASAPRGGWSLSRAGIIEELGKAPGRHLILVRYGPGHSVHDEWVFNEAEIDGSKIVWARAMSPERDAELVRYFHDRQTWLLEPEARRLTPLPRGDAALAAQSTAN
jgi:hypothetical protein